MRGDPGAVGAEVRLIEAELGEIEGVGDNDILSGVAVGEVADCDDGECRGLAFGGGGRARVGRSTVNVENGRERYEFAGRATLW
jgi:hypothetical protein